MKIRALLVLLLLGLCACVPTLSSMTLVYASPAESVLTAAAQLGPSLRPGGDFGAFRIESRTAQTLTLAASETMGSQVVGALAGQGRATVRVFVSVTPLGQGRVQATVSAVPADNAAAMNAAGQLAARLEGRFGSMGAQ